MPPALRGSPKLRSITFAPDELVLLIISLVRTTHPSMLRQESDGFAIDFELLDKKKVLTEDERLLFKVRALMDSADAQPSRIMHVNEDESARLVAALVQLQKLQAWPADVLEMCRTLRSRLSTSVSGA
jgi:hypothetical protein